MTTPCTYVHVSFTDDTYTVIDTWFVEAQSLKYWPYYLKVCNDDPRYLDFVERTREK